MKRLSTLLIAAALVLAALAPCASAFAAGEATTPMQVVALPGEDDLNVQLFRVDNPNASDVEITWGCTDAPDTGSLVVTAGGSAMITVSAPYFAPRTLYVTYLLNGSYSTVMRASTGSYLVSVNYVDTATGAVMFTEKRAISENETVLSVSAPDAFNYGGTEYKRVSSATLGHTYNAQGSAAQRTLTFNYTMAGTQSYKITANYIDRATSAVIGSKSYTVDVGSSVSVSGPSSYTTNNNRKYELSSASQQTYNHSYGDAQTAYEFYYDSESSTKKEPYMINIKLVSGSSVLASRNLTVAVDSSVTYDVPASYVTGSGSVYMLDAGQPAKIEHDYNANIDTRSYTVAYSTSGDTQPYDIKVNYVDALTGVKVQSTTISVAVNATVNHEAPQSFTDNGVTYTVGAGQSRSVSHQYGATKRTYNIYYDAGNAAPAQAYDITINYARNDTNATLYTTTVNVPIQQSVYHTAPSTYVSGGETFTLAAGQSSTIRHDYTSTRRSYTIFYKLQGTAAQGEQDTQQPGSTIVADRDEIDVVETGGAATQATQTTQTTGNTPDAQQPAEEQPGVATEPEQPAEPADETPEELVTIGDEETPLAAINRALSDSQWGWIAVGFVLLEGVLLTSFGIARTAARRREAREQ